jgi:hypothetical protein
LFLFAIGYKTGPQFFRGFGRGALPQVALTLLFDVTGFLTVYAVGLSLDSTLERRRGFLPVVCILPRRWEQELMQLQGWLLETRCVAH